VTKSCQQSRQNGGQVTAKRRVYAYIASHGEESRRSEKAHQNPEDQGAKL
jgi:hypothetical protein